MRILHGALVVMHLKQEVRVGLLCEGVTRRHLMSRTLFCIAGHCRKCEMTPFKVWDKDTTVEKRNNQRMDVAQFWIKIKRGYERFSSEL